MQTVTTLSTLTTPSTCTLADSVESSSMAMTASTDQKETEGDDLLSGDATLSKAARKAAKKAKKEKKSKKAAPTERKQSLSDQIVQQLVFQLRALSNGIDEDDTTVLTRLIGSPPPSNETTSLCPPVNTSSKKTTLPNSPLRAAYKWLVDYSAPATGSVYTLHDFRAVEALHTLFVRHGRTAHMGILDQSYRFFITRDHDAALYYKVHNRVAIVAGDPLCEAARYVDLFNEFADFRTLQGWQMAFMGVSDEFVSMYAHKQGWMSMRFATDRAMNPVTNALMKSDAPASSSTKRLVTQGRQLLHPDKGALQLGIYVPSLAHDAALQSNLTAVYDAWRASRNEQRAQADAPQAFITVFEPFSLPNLMVYLYTRDKIGKPNGFAALRRLGGPQRGYHIDPCIAAPWCTQRGVSDLLMYTALSLLHRAGVTFLSVGMEPMAELGVVHGLNATLERITRSVYKRVFHSLSLAGKKAFHDKFRPLDEADKDVGNLGLHIVMPAPLAHPRYILALSHMANVSLRRVLFYQNIQDDGGDGETDEKAAIVATETGEKAM